MAKFGYIISDKKVFAKDLIQFDFKKSSFSPDEVPAAVSHQFSVDNVVWINVTTTKSIDWKFDTVGVKTVYLKLTSAVDSEFFSNEIEVLSLENQKLFSSDFDLTAYEPDIMKWLPKKWSSWNLVHLRAQEYILNSLSEKRILDKDNNAYGKDDILNKTEVRDWAAALALYYIFMGLSNAADDVFRAKAKDYDDVAQSRSATARMSLDFNKNTLNDDKQTDFRSVEIRRA